MSKINHLAPLGWLASKVLARRYAALLRDQAEPLAAQQRAYAALRRRLAGTEVARASGLEGAADLAAFARTVPARGYDFFAERVDRVADGCEDSVLFHGRPEFIGLSSGTTGSNNKRILHNRATLAAFQFLQLGLDGGEQARAVELLAPQRDQEHGTHVRVGAQRVHHVLGVAVGVAAGEADQLDALLLERGGDGAGDVVGALDQVGDQDMVADALAAVLAEVAQPGHRSKWSTSLTR